MSSNPFGSGASSSSPSATPSYSLDKNGIRSDLTAELPQWILSSYGPGRDAPAELMEAEHEKSFEEARLFFDAECAKGNRQGAEQALVGAYNGAKDQISKILYDLDGAVRFITDKAKIPGNRIDVVKQLTPTGGTTGLFARDRVQLTTNTTTTGTSGFGGGGVNPSPFASGGSSNPSPFASTGGGGGGGGGSNPSPFASAGTTGGGGGGLGGGFGRPAFGQSGFGQVGQLGQKTSAWGSSNNSAFGQKPQTSVFGQPSSLSSGASPFASAAQNQNQGQSSNLFRGGNTNPTDTAFGQPSALGQKQSPFSTGGGFSNSNIAPGPFSSGNQTSSPFGGGNQQQSNSPFAGGNTNTTSSPFAQASSQQQNQSPFAQASQQQNQTLGTSPFAQPQQQPSPSPFTSGPFARAQQPPANGFAQSSPQPAPNPFGGPASAATPAPANVQNSNPYNPSSTAKHPELTSYTARDMSRRLVNFKGAPVTYKNGEPGIATAGTWSKIWFPDKLPQYNPATENGEVSDADKQKYLAAKREGRFTAGIPETPPLREWCVWDF